MSLNKTEIDALIKRNCGIAPTNNVAYSVADMTADENLALDKFLALAFKSAGKWQFDDSNHEKYPIVTGNIVHGQRDYSFTTDQQGNLILDIYKVMLKVGSGADAVYKEIFPTDQQSDEDNESFYDGQNVEAVAYKYDKTANGIFLNYVPPEDIALGLKIFINREGSYFVVGDTTKKPGVPGLFHEYFALRPSYQYAYRNGLKNKNDLKNEMVEMEADIKKHFRDRSKDEQPRFEASPVNSV